VLRRSECQRKLPSLSKLPRSSELLGVKTEPIQYLRKPKFVRSYGADDKLVPIFSFDINVTPVATKENVGRGECDPLVAVEKAVIVAERLHQRRTFFLEGGVVTSLRTENGGLHSALIPNTLGSPEHINQQVLHLVDLCHRQVLAHLLGETL
jgi:hypothetical protein